MTSILLCTLYYTDVCIGIICRLSYGLFLLHELLQRLPEKVNLHIMYDVVCTFVRHLKSNDSHLLEKVAFAVPSFHAYGHKPSCQVRHT